MRSKVTAVHLSRGAPTKHSVDLKVPKSTVTSMILKWGKFGTSRTPRAGGLGIGVSLRDVSKNPMTGWAPEILCADGRMFQKVRSTSAFQHGHYGRVSRQEGNKGQIAWTNETKMELSWLNSKAPDLRLWSFTIQHSSDSQNTAAGVSKKCPWTRPVKANQTNLTINDGPTVPIQTEFASEELQRRIAQ